MNDTEATIYQLNIAYPRITSRTFNLSKTDKIVIDADGYTQITLVDACQSGHNGDWYDDHESGYQTFKQAKTALLKETKENFKKTIEHIKGLKESK